MTTSQNTVLLAGATGLVGGHCLRLLRATPSIGQIVPVVRRPIAEAGPRLLPIVTEFAALEQSAPVPARAALCALGTTIKKAGSKDGFRAVDYDAVLEFARFAIRSGVEVFGLVSSIGAAADSGNFYLRIKGKAEEAIASLGFRCFVALRPSLLLGAREESRPGETVSQVVFPLFTPLLQGKARRFRAIRGEQVAAALTSLVVRPPLPGRYIWNYDDILAAAEGGNR